MVFKDVFRVLLASSGDEGLSLLRRETVHAVILDLKMEGKTGLETLEQMRRGGCRVPVIILTGYGTIDAVKQAMHLGAIEFLSKPFDLADIDRLVRSAVERRKLEIEAEMLAGRLSTLNSELQERLERTERLALIGRISAEILHEINNPLTVIHGYAQLLLDELESGGREPAERGKYLAAIGKEVARCQAISRLFLSLSRNGIRRRPVDVNAEVEKTASFFRESLAAGRVEFILSLDPAVPKIRGDADLIHQALVNLILNAVDAMGKEGRIEMRTAPHEHGLSLTVADSGPGIAPESMARVFEPFFTTKEGSGTGLGLAITREIITRHGGEISVASEPGIGSVFTVMLPAGKTAGGKRPSDGTRRRTRDAREA